MFKLVGIDCGDKGAIVEIDVNEKLCRWMKMPWREDDLLDEYKIKKYFDFNSANYIYIEKVSANKLFGCSNFSFGFNYGSILSMIGREYPYQLVSPKIWQRRFNCNGNSDQKLSAKLRTMSSFRKMNPNFGKITKSDHEGLIDAFFIGYYGGLVNNVIMPVDFNFEKIE